MGQRHKADTPKELVSLWDTSTWRRDSCRDYSLDTRDYPNFANKIGIIVIPELDGRRDHLGLFKIIRKAAQEIWIISGIVWKKKIGKLP